jgi:hypothetical protein
MDAHNDTTQTGGPATTASPQITIELERLAALNLESACGLGAAIDTLSHVIRGLICQAVNNNDAGQILREVAQFLMILHDRVVEVVEDRIPEGVEETNRQFWTMLQHRVGWVYYLEEMVPGYGEANIPDIGVLVATAVRDMSEAKRKARSQAWADAMGKA